MMQVASKMAEASKDTRVPQPTKANVVYPVSQRHRAADRQPDQLGQKQSNVNASTILFPAFFLPFILLLIHFP